MVQQVAAACIFLKNWDATPSTGQSSDDIHQARVKEFIDFASFSKNKNDYTKRVGCLRRTHILCLRLKQQQLILLVTFRFIYRNGRSSPLCNYYLEFFNCIK